MDEHLYLITYDIRCPKRWRRVFRLMKGYGEWLQLSVFQCRLSKRRHAELIQDVDGLLHHHRDDMLVIDLGPADKVKPRVVAFGKRFEAVGREPVIV